jgi:hypothetical protein
MSEQWQPIGTMQKNKQQIAVTLTDKIYVEIQNTLLTTIDGILKKDMELSMSSVRKARLILSYLYGYQKNEETEI